MTPDLDGACGLPQIHGVEAGRAATGIGENVDPARHQLWHRWGGSGRGGAVVVCVAPIDLARSLRRLHAGHDPFGPSDHLGLAVCGAKLVEEARHLGQVVVRCAPFDRLNRLVRVSGHPVVAPQDLRHQFAPVRGAAAVSAQVKHHIGGRAQSRLSRLHVGDQGGQLGVRFAGRIAVERRRRNPETTVVERFESEVDRGALDQPGAARAQIIGRGPPVQGVGLGRAIGLEPALAHFVDPWVLGAEEQPVSEEDMLAEVWGQEDDVRAESAEWLFPYLLLAYEGLTEQEMRDYLAFSGTPGGKALNAAVFAAFDEMFVQLSEALGRAAADVLAGSDI